MLVRPARKDDVIAFRGQPYKESFKGIVAEMDGRVLAIAGVLHTQPLQAFSSIEQEIKNHPKTVVVMIKKMKEILSTYGDSPIFATANPNEQTAPGLLKHAGFEYYQEGVYRWVIQ